MSGGAYGWLHRAWYERAAGYQLLIPLALLYAGIVLLRRALYRAGILRAIELPVPVVVVGNIVAGGAGKTPVTLFLAQSLRERGFRPGIVSRGYGRTDADTIVDVRADSAASEVGDEPLLLARRSGCPVTVGRDRVAASRRLIDSGADVIIADDGLQHYKLARNFELCVVDAERGFGNGWQIPAGPLREAETRINEVDAVLLNKGSGNVHESIRNRVDGMTEFALVADDAERIDGSASRPLAQFAGSDVHAVAGIGNPARFFGMLEKAGLTVQPHPLPDHASLSDADLDFPDTKEVLMTEKDAVKLPQSSGPRLWSVPVTLAMQPDAARSLLDAIEKACREKQENQS